MSQPMPYNRRIPVAFGDAPAEDRHVSVTTVRLMAVTVYVVGVVDGTGRLAEPHSLLATADLSRARRHANKLLTASGGPAWPPETDPAPSKHQQYLARKRDKSGVAS